MPPATVQFESPELKLLVDAAGAPFSTEIDGWRISEAYVPDQYYLRSVRVGSYRVRMEFDVSGDYDAGGAYIAGCFLARQLDRAWTYATGMTLTGRGYDLFLRPTHPPAGWVHNAEAVVPLDDLKLIQSRISHLSAFRATPTLPLSSAVDALLAWARADEVTQAIGELHTSAMETVDRELPYLLFAQALEAARPLFDGDTAIEQQARLPVGVRERQTRDLKWLFKMGHQRRETRHIVDKAESVVLKASFDEREAADFLHDSSLVLHFLVTKALGLPLVFNEHGRTIVMAAE